MTANVDIPEAQEARPPRPGARPPSAHRRTLWTALAIAAAVVAAALVGARVAVNTDPGRAWLVRTLTGLRIGPAGRLQVQGLHGDILGDFRLDRLAIVDAKGPWLEARDAVVRWNAGELLARRVHVKSLLARRLTILRRPVMEQEPARPPQKLPVSLVLDDVRLGLETLPAFSVRHGLWDVAGALDLERSGDVLGRLEAQSRERAGDGVEARFQVGARQKLLVKVDAVEAEGGALAGALGLQADRRFYVHVLAEGATQAGRMTATTALAEITPLRAEATWGKAGTRVQAHALLGLSHWTHFLAERVGEAGDLDLTARRQSGDLYDIEGTFTGPKGRLHATGPVDWKTRAAKGLDVQLAVSDLHAWVPFPRIGPARAQGRLDGDLGHFRYAGRLDGERLDQNDFTLARMGGPAVFTHTPGEWRLQADLQGQGGGGRGVVASLLGPSPHVKLDGSRIKDGRFVFRVLDVQGRGVKVLAEGGQALFGGALGFKGSAVITDPAVAHKGAHGTLTGSWRASEPKGGHVWSFDFDARGERFASGYAEADRLVGSRPRLTAKASWGSEQGLVIDSANLAGAALQGTAKGRIDPNGGLGVDLTYEAKGPFGLGPVEIAGQVKGAGRLTGRLSEPRVDLQSDLASLDAGRLVIAPAHVSLSFLHGPQQTDGLIAVNGPSLYGPASAKAAFRLLESGIDLTGIVADAGGLKATGAVSLRGGAPSSADLDIALGPGAFLDAGRLAGTVKLTDARGSATAAVALTGQDIASPLIPVALRSLKLTANGPLSRLPYQLQASSDSPVAWKWRGSGVTFEDKGERKITLEGQGVIRRAAVQTLQPAVLRLGRDRTLSLKVSVGRGGRAELEGRLAPDGMEARATVSDVALTGFQPDYVGQVSGSATLKGRGAHLSGELTAALEGARSRDAPADLALAAQVRSTLVDTRLHLDAAATNVQGLKSSLTLDLPTEATAAPFRIALVRTKPLEGAFSADGEIRPLWDLIAGGQRSVAGRIQTEGRLSGTLAELHADGQASLSRGRFADAPTGLVLQDVNGAATFGGNTVNVKSLSGSDGRGGTLSGAGRISVETAGASTFELKLNRFQLIDNEIARAIASGAVTVTRDAKGQARIVGALGIDRADITAKPLTPTGVVSMEVREIHVPRREDDWLAQPKTGGPQAALDVAIRAPRGVFVKGRGLNVELSVDAHVGGTTSQPDLTGLARVFLGSYDFSGKRFEFDENGTVRLASKPEAIRLDLRAVREDPALTAVVRVQGTAAKPEITLSSTPVLPQDEVLSRVLFGVSASQLSPGEAAQLAAAVAALATGGGFDVIGGLRQIAGLDRLAIGAGPAGATVSGGKYVTDNVYVELTGGGRNTTTTNSVEAARSGSSAQVEWRVRRDLSIVSQVWTGGDARLSIRFRKDY